MSPLSDASTFAALRLAAQRRQLQWVFWILLIPLVVFTLADVTLAEPGERIRLRLVARGGIAVLLWFGFVILPRRLDEAPLARVVTIATLGSVPFLLGMHVLRPRDSLAFFTVDAVIVAALYGLIPNRRRWQTTGAVLLTVGALLLLFAWHTDVSPMEVVTVLTAFGVANAAGLSAALAREQREQREEAIFAREQEARAALEQTLAELRTLRGILPICSHCKRVREDDGDWEAIEAYVRRHSEAEFSHGICPDCLTRHYPETLIDGA